jgi:YVTN family beta-propeller protein
LRSRTLALALPALVLAPALAVFAAKPEPSQSVPAPAGTDRAAAAEATLRPGPQGGGVTLLPNGWRIAPAGRHLDAGDLPLAMALHPDGRHLVITNNGWSKPSLRVVDLDRWQVTQRAPLDHAWLGLAWHPDGRRLFSSGAADNTIREFDWRDGRLVPARTFRLGPAQKTVRERLVDPGYVAGLALSADAGVLYAAQVFGEAVVAVDVETGETVARAPLPAEGYAVAVAPDGGAVYASVWGGARVSVFSPRTLKPVAEITVGEHPNAMAFSKDGRRLFVACAHTNAVWVVDLAARRAQERIGIALTPNAPPGSTPNALAVSPDGATLLVANADNNTVAVVDVTRPGESRFLGFVPTGWYPTGVAFDPRGERVLVLSGKGLAPAANPRGPQPVSPRDDAQYIGGLLSGALSVLPRPQGDALAAMTARVRQISAYQDSRAEAPPGRPQGCPVPARVGEPSSIKHVFYVIRENRTYDQVLGDLPRGNGDPNLTLFGADVTPNAHALATEFVLFDNFYVDAEVSMDGHSYSTAAYASDAIEKTWPTSYGGRGGLYLGEGSHKERNDYGNLAAPAAGYLWDFAARAGVSVRSYGEFARWEKEKGGPVVATVPGLRGRVHPSYPPYDLTVSDNARVDVWLEEFRRFEKDGGLPQLSIVRLGNDHTMGTTPGALTPRAYVAENDRALGRLVEAVAGSRFWAESAIFVVEDDAQNGPDHVDAHRSVLLVAGGRVKRGALDSGFYSTASVLRTIELILGIPPMSQYDAAAQPLFTAFAAKPDAAAFRAREPRVPLTDRNGADAPGAEASLRMNLQGEADLAPELELNQVIWKSVRGAASEMPPPVRAAFVRPIANADDGEEAAEGGGDEENEPRR